MSSSIHDILSKLLNVTMMNGSSPYYQDYIRVGTDFIKFTPFPPTKRPKGLRQFVLQVELEKHRPDIDYIVLYDSSILVGLSSHFDQLKRTAIGITMKHTLQKAKELLHCEQQLLSAYHFYTTKPFSDMFPELVL